METVIETIDRKTATKYLEKNEGNRPISPGHVMNLVARQKRGEWMPNGADAIVFDTDGNLRNGQHRLQMVMMTGEPIEAVVTREVPPESFLIFDDGKLRTVTDVLGIMGEENPALLGASVDWVWRYLMRTTSGTTPTKTQLLKLLDKHPNIRESVSFCLQKFIPGTTDKSLIVAFHWLTQQVDPGRSDTFISQFIHGFGWNWDDGSDPVYVLREQMHRYQSNPRQPPLTRHQKLELFVRAWNHGQNKRLRSYFMPHRTGKFADLLNFPEDLHFEPEDENKAAFAEPVEVGL